MENPLTTLSLRRSTAHKVVGASLLPERRADCASNVLGEVPSWIWTIRKSPMRTEEQDRTPWLSFFMGKLGKVPFGEFVSIMMRKRR